MGIFSKRAVSTALTLVTLLLVGAVASRPASGQVLYGSVIGTITDPSDAAVAGAAVTLTNKQTGLARDVLADDGGRYSLVNLLPGVYTLKVAAKGFRTSTRLDFPVSPDTVGSRRRQDGDRSGE